MKIFVTARELLDAGVWSDYCDKYDVNRWAVNEGLMEDTRELSIEPEDVARWGLI